MLNLCHIRPHTRTRARTGLALSLTLGLAATAAAADPRTTFPTNLWIGSGGLPFTQGMTFPGATRPFGAVRLSPDTMAARGLMKWVPVGSGAHSAGYRYQHDRIEGFSHTRLSGTGARDGGVFRTLPMADLRDFKRRGEGLAFSHDDEQAVPGYYRVEFPRDRFTAELTASPHCGFHRYSKHSRKAPLHLLIDVASALHEKTGKASGRVRWEAGSNVIEGESRTFGAFASRQGGLRTYFYAELSSGVAGGRLWKNSRLVDAREAEGTDVGVAIESARGAQSLELAICLSTVSAENARLNFEAEARGRTFDDAREAAQDAWSSMLGRIQAESSDRSLLRVFHTMHYFASIMPTQGSDVNGEYLGFGGIIGRADDFTYRTDLSLWDTFRTAHPLYTLVAPEVQRDSLKSLLRMSEYRGVFPRWPFAAADSGSMFGLPAHFLLAESWLKGIRDFDAPAALRAMVKGATDDDFSREAVCREFGYCPGDRVKKWSVSKTLENAWSDFAVARFAESIGETETATRFFEQSRAFETLWDPSRRFFRPRDSQGNFMPFSPSLLSYLGFLGKGTDHFAEGSAHQWRYSAPHAPETLIRLFGGPEAFVHELNSFLKGAAPRRGFFYPGNRYWHGNQHDLHVIYLFNEAGRPDLTQRWARWALRTRYADAADGIDGNDDGGTISSWFVLSALGLYPQVGTERYWLGSPALDRATLALGEERTLRIVAYNQGRNHPYVQSVWRNGQRWCQPSITHAELIDAELVFRMGPRPAPRGGYDCATPSQDAALD